MEHYLPRDDLRPTAAVVVSLIGALLIVFDGVAFMVAGSVASSVGLYGASNALGGLGFVGILLGLIVLILAISLYRNPDSHTGYGVVILLLSLVSIVSGGGFILGLVLGVIGGILAIVFSPEVEPLPGSMFTATSASLGQRCRNCGTMVPSLAVACPSCETPVLAK